MTPRRPRVLMTLPDVAWPVVRGKALRVESLVRGVAARCDVDAVVVFAEGDRSVRPFPPDVDVQRWAWLPAAPLPAARAGRALLRRGVPWQTAVHDWSVVAGAVSSWPDDYDVVWFGCLDHAISLRGLRRGARVVTDCDDVETAKLAAFLSLPRRPGEPRRDRLQRRVELPLWRRVQRQVVADADAVLVCSDLDRRRLVAETGADPVDVTVVPNTFRGPEAVPARVPATPVRVLVVANYGTDQNVDAAHFAVREVLPALRARVPGAVLRLVGRQVERIEDLRGTPGLELVGPVEDVAPELAAAAVVLVPVRYGGGTRLKILEAFAHGVPVVSTRAGAEGLDVVDGDHLLLADAPAALADAVGRLVDDPARGVRLAAAGRLRWQESYTPEAAGRAVDTVLDRVLR